MPEETDQGTSWLHSYIQAEGIPESAPTQEPAPRQPNWFIRLFSHVGKAPRPVVMVEESAQEPQDDFTRLRQTVESFTGDAQSSGKRFMVGCARFVGYTAPFLVVALLGTGIGGYFAPYWGAFTAYGTSYLIESVIASLTTVLGHQLAHLDKSAGNITKMVVALMVWLIAQGSSAFAFWVMANANPVTTMNPTIWSITVAVRVAAIALVDVSSVVILFFADHKSLQRHLAETHEKELAVVKLSETEAEIKKNQRKAVMFSKQEDLFFQFVEQQFSRVISQEQGVLQRKTSNQAVTEMLPSDLLQNRRTFGYSEISSHSQGRAVSDGELGTESVTESLHYSMGDAPKSATVFVAPDQANQAKEINQAVTLLLQANPKLTGLELAKLLRVGKHVVYRSDAWVTLHKGDESEVQAAEGK